MRRSRILLVVCVTFLSLAGASSAAAGGGGSPQPPQPPASSALSQYVEQIPTAGGSVAAGFGSEKAGHLSAKVQKRLSQLPPKTDKLLTKVATSSQYGAPARVTKPVASRAGVKRPRAGVKRPAHVAAPPKIGSTVSALADSIDAGGLSGVVGLGIVLLSSTFGLIGASLLRRRNDRYADAPRRDWVAPSANQ